MPSGTNDRQATPFVTINKWNMRDTDLRSLPSLKLIQGHFMRGGYIIDKEIVGSKAKYRKSRGSLTLTK